MSTDGIKAGMKPRVRHIQIEDDHLLREQCVHPPAELDDRMPPVRIKGNDLSLRMNPGIGATRCHNPGWDSRQLRKNTLDLGLNCGGVRLTLKPSIARAVIPDDRPDPHPISVG
jgi:hypothetical protein